MTIEFLEQKFKKHSKVSIITGAILFLLGIGLVLLFILTDQVIEEMGEVGSYIAFSILAFIFLGTGFFLMFMAGRTLKQLNNGTNPMIKAFREGDQSYIMWVYENITQAKGSGGVGARHQLMIWSIDGKVRGIMLKKKDIPGALRLFMEHFPDADYGYTAEIEKKYKDWKKGKKRPQ